jgi:hypothetical protein
VRAPQTPIGRGLLSFTLSLMLLIVVDYVVPDGDTAATRIPGGGEVLSWLHLKQRWNMFSDPGPRGAFVESLGLTADGRTVHIVQSMEPPEGPFLRLGYDRMLKVHNALGHEKPGSKLSRRYARWLCTQSAEPLASAQVVKVALKRPTMAQWRGDPNAVTEKTRVLLAEVSCAP